MPHLRPSVLSSTCQAPVAPAALSCVPQRPASKQTGSSLIEFSIVAVPILLFGLGSIEVAQWFFVKQAVSLALLEAARAGITQHAKPNAIETAFERALLPLYPPTATKTSLQRLQQALRARSAVTQAPAWQIEIINPSSAAFDDFADPHLSIRDSNGARVINNNYQTEQDTRNRNNGWANGLGPKSGLSVYEANTLILRATYLHEPTLSGVKNMLKMLPTGGASTFARRAMSSGGYIPIKQEIMLTMQSHPVDWPALASGTVIKRGNIPAGNDTDKASLPCHGIWCLDASRPGGSDVTSPANNHAAVPEPYYPVPGNTQGITDNLPGSPGATGTGPEQAGGGAETGFNDPACGVSLCCVPA